MDETQTVEIIEELDNIEQQEEKEGVQYFYCTENNTFLVEGLHSIPAHAIAVSKSDYQYLIDGRAKGKAITVMNGTLTLTSVRPSVYHELNGTEWTISEEQQAVLFAEQKANLLTTLVNKTDSLKAQMLTGYPTAEIESFYKQEEEAKAILKAQETGEAVSAPLLTALSSQRGVELVELAQKVILKADVVASATGALLGTKQKFETAIENATTSKELKVIQAEVAEWSL